MKDINNVEIKLGDIVEIKGSCVKRDNGLYMVKHVPGQPNWSGSDVSLEKILKSGKMSKASYSVNSFPLVCYINDRQKSREIKEYNAKNATIEVRTDINNTYVLENLKEELESYKVQAERIKMYNGEGKLYNEYLEIIEFYKNTIEKAETEEIENNEVIAENAITKKEPVKTESIEKNNNTTCKVNFNQEKNGIELLFSEKPSQEIRNNIKVLGFRWSKFNKVWYAKDTDIIRGKLKDIGLLQDGEKEVNTEYLNANTITLEEVIQEKVFINESLAKRNKENMSFDNYKENSATNEYNEVIEEIKNDIIENNQQNNIKVLILFKRYIKQYGNWINKHNSNGAGHVSIMLTGAGNYNMKKHNRYLEREGNLWKEYEKIKDIKDKIYSSMKKSIKEQERIKTEKAFNNINKDFDNVLTREKISICRGSVEKIFNNANYKINCYNYNNEYYIIKNWGYFRIYNKNGNEIEVLNRCCKSLVECKKCLMYILQEQEKQTI